MAAGVGPLIATVPTITYQTISEVEKWKKNETYGDACMGPEEPSAYEQR